MRDAIKPLVLIVLFLMIVSEGCSNESDTRYLQQQIERLRKEPQRFFHQKDARVMSIRDILDVDIYAGRQAIYIEWDEKNYPVESVTVRRKRPGEKKTYVRTITRTASQIGHRWNYFADRDLIPGTQYDYELTIHLKEQKPIQVAFSVKTLAGTASLYDRQFRIYDDIEGGSGDKAAYLKRHTPDGTMKRFGLNNSAMYWVDDFYTPKPDLDDSRSRLEARPDIKKLQKLIYADMTSPVPHRKIDPKEGIVVLDIEHVPSVLEYVIREYSPYGAFVSKFVETEKVRNNGKRIVLEAIARKLEAIQAVKRLLPNTKVGLWNSVVLWNRYNDNTRNKDDLALAKGTDVAWRITYPIWHPDDALIYKVLMNTVDYVMPVLYPMFDLSDSEGKKRQLGYMLSKLTEIRRINPDQFVIASISPHYTEGWTYKAGLAHKPLSYETFQWYLNTMYRFYQEGLVDSIEIWADNDGTRFEAFTRQGWWRALLEFTKKAGLRN